MAEKPQPTAASKDKDKDMDRDSSGLELGEEGWSLEKKGGEGLSREV
jgi:hypothetical protein